MGVRATVLMLLAAAAVGVLAGCGGGGDGGAAKPADVVRDYHVAIADGKPKDACDQLSEGAQKQLRESTQGAARDSCEKVIELLAAFYDATTKKALTSARVRVDENGDSATASFDAPVGLGGPAQEQTYGLIRDDGAWKIDQLSVLGN